MPEELLGDAVPRGGARAAQVIKTADQVAQALLLGRRGRDETQLARAIQAHELLGVAAVGLDAIAGAHRHQRRRDHVARDTEAPEQPEQVIAAGPGLVGDSEPAGPAKPVDEPADRAFAALDALNLRRPARRRQRRGHDRVLVHIQRHPQAHLRGRGRANVRHRLVLHAALAETAD